jgi:transcription initiation factor TFIIIB Brf1 subunit/transcription initiation factor TFIIB
MTESVTFQKPNINLRDLARLRKQKNTTILNEENIITTLSCESCGAKPLIPHDGFMVCKSCGLCQSRDIDCGQEWRNHDNGDKSGIDQSRACMPNNSLIPDSGMGTVIGYSSNKKNNNSTSHIVRTINNWKLVDYKESSMNKRFKHITNICRQADISSMIIEEAKIIFFKISNLVSARRTKLTALQATSVIIALKIKGYERDMSDIAGLFALDVKVLRKLVKDYERIWKEIQEKERDEQELKARDTITNLETAPMDHEPEMCISLSSVNDDVVIIDDNKKLRKLLIDLSIESMYFDDIFKINKWVIANKILFSHIPKSRYACLIYLLDRIYELNIDKSDIVTLCDTSTVTINKCFNKLVPYYEEIKALIIND